MPPKNLRRPAARILRVADSPRVRGDRRLKRPASLGEADPPEDLLRSGWIKTKDWRARQVSLGKAIIAKIWYCGEEGLLHGILRDETKDLEGQWLGVKLLGTNIDQLRNWALTQGVESNLYLGLVETPLDQRRHMGGIGYLLELKEKTDADQEAWQKNCLPEGRSRARDSRSPERSSSAGRCSPRRLSSPKGKGGRNSGGGSCSQETEWETESEKDGRESEMVPKGHSSGPLLQEAYTAKGSEEEEEKQLFEFKGLRLFQHIGRGLRLGASASGHQQASSRLPCQAVRQGSHQDVGQSDRGRTGRVSGLQPVLPSGSTRKGGESRSPTRTLYPLLGCRPHDQWRHSLSPGRPLSENQRIGTTPTRGRVQPSCPGRASSEGAVRIDPGRGREVRPQRVCSGKQTPETAEGLLTAGERGLDWADKGRAKLSVDQGEEGQALEQVPEQGGRREERRGKPGGSCSPSSIGPTKPVVMAEGEKRNALRELLIKKKKEFSLGEIPASPQLQINSKVGIPFPPEPPSEEALAALAKDPGFSPCDAALLGASNLSHGAPLAVLPGSPGGARAAENEPAGEGCDSLLGLGAQVLKHLPQLLSRVTSFKQDSSMEGIFPLPLPQDLEGTGVRHFEAWVRGVVLGLNWLTGRNFQFGPSPPTSKQARLLDGILRSLSMLDDWDGLYTSEFDPRAMFHQRWVNAYGEEVHVAQSVRWENITESLPKEGLAGVVPAVEICEGGTKEFLSNPQDWLKPPKERIWMKPPRIMIDKEEWPLVAQGLIDRGICGVMPLASAVEVNGGKILGGMFGVPKHEFTQNGVPILRLIMDFRPINENFLNLGGDLTTLPVLSQLFQLEVRPHEDILISSEDIRAMFYIIGLPPTWNKFLGFGKVLPRSMNPPGFPNDDFILYSKVLPMGFVNSVSVAQHLHRRLVIRAFNGKVSASQEIRRDKELPMGPLFYRVYLDNFDVLSIQSKQLLESEEPSLIGLLQKTYSDLNVPRNEKKAVLAQNMAEVQGAWVDGRRGICRAKGAKVAKYLAAVAYLLQKGKASQKEMQMVSGGLVYLFSFRRPLMSLLNEVWYFIAGFKDPNQIKSIPNLVKEELFASFYLTSLAFMDFRLESSPVVTASDASEQGGGLCATEGLTAWGLRASLGTIRGERFEQFQELGLLIVSLFDGIGSLRVCLDSLHVPLAGYISVEKDPCARRVLESHYPTCTFVENVLDITEDMVRQWAALYPNCLGVLVAGGPPCQGVSSLIASKKGAILDPRSSLHEKFKQVRRFCKETFVWCPCYFLMESVASMSPEDRATYTQSAGVIPYKVDSRFLSLCKRPRLWWFNWSIPVGEETEIFPPKDNSPESLGEIRFHHPVSYKGFLRPGWKPVDTSEPFATFTTAQPSRQPRFRPAGLDRATELDRQKWAADRHRFPPYAYSYKNGVHHPKKGWRMLSIEEKELIMGFPLNYTEQCKPKNFRTGNPQTTDDIRMSLIGNSWHCGVVCCLLYPLCRSLGLLSPTPIPTILRQLHPEGNEDVGSILLKEAYDRPSPFQKLDMDQHAPQRLVSKICHLVSAKGSDVLLTSNNEHLRKYHRLSNSLYQKICRWKILCGWKWKPHQSGCPEHINKLELRAVQTALRWRLFRHKESSCRILHLVDSMVSLQVLNKGRSSSHKLRATCKKIAALQLVGNFMLVLAYTSTKTNPADRPSRECRKRKWASVK